MIKLVQYALEALFIGLYTESLLKLRNWLPQEQPPLLASGQELHLLSDEKLLPWIAWKPSEE